jgi:integrase
VLAIYYQDKGAETCPDKNLLGHIERLNEFWGDKMLIEINPKVCSDYVASRPGLSGARRDLEVLRASINNHARQNLHYGSIRVTIPNKNEARANWITRDQAAAIIWAAWRYRDTRTIRHGRNAGQMTATGAHSLRHIARFLLIGIYTGSRAGAITSASIRKAPGKSFVDLETGLFHRLAIGKRRTKKRQPIAPLPPRLLAHMRRWVRRGIIKENFIEYQGRPVLRLRKGFAKAVRLSGVQINVTPSTTRHTAATWLMQAGVNEWETSGYLGMSIDVLRDVYGHHHPNYMAGAVKGITANKSIRKIRGSICTPICTLEGACKNR